jgi:hypothetical protein
MIDEMDLVISVVATKDDIAEDDNRLCGLNACAVN